MLKTLQIQFFSAAIVLWAARYEAACSSGLRSQLVSALRQN